MIERIRCWQCGKAAVVTPHDAGQRVVCAACGAIQDALPGGAEEAGSAISRFGAMWGDKTAPTSPLPAEKSRPATLPPTLAPATVDLPADALSSGSDEREERPAPRRWGWWPLAAACVGAAIIIALLAMMATREDETTQWQQRIVSEIGTLREHAESLEKRGDISGARQRYEQIVLLIEGRAVTNPQLIAELEKTRQARQRLPRSESPMTRAAATVVVREESPPAKDQVSSAAMVPPDAPRQIRSGPATAPARIAARPAIRPTTIPTQVISDEDIGIAIRKGATFLLAQFQDGLLRREKLPQSHAHFTGLDALAVYALLAAGDATDDPRLSVRGATMKQMLEKLRDLPTTGNYETYARGIRATALAHQNRNDDRKALREDLVFLLKAHRKGSYTYGDSNPQGQLVRWDNSNSQYGLLGVWAAAEAGAEVPTGYWNMVQKHWAECQLESGEWAYQERDREARLAMTLAGIASLFVAHDQLDVPVFGSESVGRKPFSDPLARGLAWLERGNNSITVPLDHEWSGYTLYGVERVGLASGFKYFGEHDWYRTLADQLVRTQQPDGSWNLSGAWPGWARSLAGIQEARDANHTELHNTAFRLLFLARGRHPIVMNKLRYAGAWANRPRDVANLTRYASKALERGLNWQVVQSDREYQDWLDAPILYFANHVPPSLSDAELNKLRLYALAGGMIFTQADGGSPSFNRWIEDVPMKLFALPWREVPDDHELWSMNFKIDPRPRLRYVTNGSRILMVHSPNDLTQQWQLRSERTQKQAFETGVNLFLWAGGKTDLRNRLSSPYLPEPPATMGYTLRVSRLRHGGNANDWNPEPMAWDRFSRWFAFQTGYTLRVTDEVPAALDAKVHDVVHLTGTGTLAINLGEIEAIRKYVEEGGTLLIDACGGSSEFAESVRATLGSHLFPGKTFEPIPDDHALLRGTGEGMDELPKLLVRPYAEQKLGRRPAQIEMIEAGKGRVLFSALDFTTALLGTNSWGILGYRPATAQSFVKNLLLWTVDRAP